MLSGHKDIKLSLIMYWTMSLTLLFIIRELVY
jgi:hypothetical protein